ncbi:hypothetical protein ACQEU8_03855 [Streptomyces sp. CA-250714]|uniref:hypothetical protein n=1 Tax=Streptomyces sp. CA-250714 TaxID=3240060 RepID=UPI003D8B5783
MPNPTPDDLTLSRAYLLWVNEDFEERRETLPDREVEITVPAMWPYPKQVVKLGEELHSFLNPANPGAGPKLVVALGTGDVPVDNLKGLGWHIHPGILNDDQIAEWTDSTDLREADWIHQLYEEERATRGYVPTRIDSAERNEKRKNSEPDWSLGIRRKMNRSRAGEDYPWGPAAAWALIGNEIPVQRSQESGRVRISSRAPLDSERAARERGEMLGRNIRALYDWGIIPLEHVPPSAPRGRQWPEWAKKTLSRIAHLAIKGDSAVASEEPEITALNDSAQLTLQPTENGKGFKIAIRKTYPTAAILANLEQLPPDLRKYGPDGPSQQAAPGVAESAPQLGASYGQPPAVPPFQPSAAPLPQNPTLAEAARALAPPIAGGYQFPSSEAEAETSSRAAKQQRESHRRRGRK